MELKSLIFLILLAHSYGAPAQQENDGINGKKFLSFLRIH